MKMKSWKRGMVFVAAAIGAVLLAGADTASAKTGKVELNLTGTPVQNRRPQALEKAKKVTIKCSKPSVVKVKYKKNRKDKRIVFTGKKKGTAVVTVKCHLKNKKTKSYKYKVRVVKGKKVSDLDRAKEAFKIQNQYRKEKGVAALEWSDELYRFCLYRLKNSGFDAHKNLGRDMNGYFGDYVKYKHLLFSENQDAGNSSAKATMKVWKSSSGHYQNLLSKNHVCGAIACYNNMWCAIFYDKDKSEVENWRDYQIKKITVKRYDSGKGTYLGGCSIGYYETDDHWNTLQAATISKASGKDIYLAVGKTYTIYERKKPDGCEKAESVTITVTEDGISEITLNS